MNWIDRCHGGIFFVFLFWWKSLNLLIYNTKKLGIQWEFLKNLKMNSIVSFWAKNCLFFFPAKSIWKGVLNKCEKLKTISLCRHELIIASLQKFNLKHSIELSAKHIGIWLIYISLAVFKLVKKQLKWKHIYRGLHLIGGHAFWMEVRAKLIS